MGAVATLILLMLMGIAGPARAETLNALEKTYSQITSVEAHFHQTILIKALKREREMEGDFYYKRSKGFLWKYTAPKEKIFLYDGAALWQADGGAPFVTRQRIDKEHMEGKFLDLVDDVTRLDALFTLVRSDQAGGDGRPGACAEERRDPASGPHLGGQPESHQPGGDRRDHGKRQRDRLLEGSGEQAPARQPLCLQAGRKGDKGIRREGAGGKIGPIRPIGPIGPMK